MRALTLPLRWISTTLVGARCPGCGIGALSPDPCASCAVELVALAGGSPTLGILPDIAVAARLVRAGKYGAWRGAGAWFAAWMLTRPELTSRAAGIDCVTWVPADRARRARRGGHLPEAIARPLAASLGVPALELLQRRPGSQPQRGAARGDRLANAYRSFRASPRLQAQVAAGRRQPLVGWRALLIDDVATTGATLEATATILHALGASPVPVAVTGVELRQDSRASCGFLDLTVSQLPADEDGTARKDPARSMRRPALPAARETATGPASPRPP